MSANNASSSSSALVSFAAHHCLKHLSLAPYYATQMRHCTQKWDKHNNQGVGSEIVDTCHQLVGVVSTGLYHSMADVQMTVSAVLVLSGSYHY